MDKKADMLEKVHAFRAETRAAVERNCEELARRQDALAESVEMLRVKEEEIGKGVEELKKRMRDLIE